MDVVGLFVPADGVHVSVKTFTHVEVIAFQSETFPFGERVDDLERLVVLLLYAEADRALHAV